MAFQDAHCLGDNEWTQGGCPADLVLSPLAVAALICAEDDPETGIWATRSAAPAANNPCPCDLVTPKVPGYILCIECLGNVSAYGFDTDKWREA